MTKVCFTCKITKPVTEFGVHKRSKDGRRGQCLECRTAYTNAWRENNIDAVRATGRRYANRNTAKRNAYIREYRTGFSDEYFKAKMVEQNDTCAICEVPFILVPSKGIHADHDHSTNETRGILCRDCNRGLGGFSDSPEVVDRAAAYLRHYRGAPAQPDIADLQRQLAEREVELATKIEQVLKDAGPMENRDATLKSILELLK